MNEETEFFCVNCGTESDGDAYTECPVCGWPESQVEFEPDELDYEA